ncbi:GIP, partial [Symbiodinium microadriaticum]
AIQCKLGDMEFQKGICRFRNTEFQKGICKLGDMEFQKGICKLGDMEFQKGIFKLGNTEFQKGIFRLGDMEFQKGISRLLEGISMDTEFHIAQVLWSRVVQARNLYGGDHGRLSVGQGGGLFTGSRERGGMFDVAPGDVAYRQPEIQRGATFGDYDYEIGGSNPPRLSGPDGGLGGGPATARLDESGPSAAKDVEGSSAQPSTSTTKPGLAAETTTATPSPMDVLITGMTQLQQVLLRQKPEGLDLEPKAVQELAKLPEYAPETGAIDFQDFLYLAEQQIGSLASGAGDWWSRTLAVAQESYAEYQAMSPMRRLSVKPTLTSELRDERYKKLERKVAALLLAALPKSVREEMIAYRVQGTHQILFRLMIVYQPGGAQDRAQLLRQLDVTESAAGPVEAIASLRRWYRLLQRAADIGVKLPDESIQTRSLTMIVKKTADSFPDFKFRMALARTELQIDTRPTQDSVMRYLQHLLAELEHLGGNKKPAAATGTATTTSTTSAATTTLKGIQTQGDATPKAKAKSVAEKPCKYFATEDGCRRGRDCTFTHAWDGLQRSDRCLLCGSTKHRMKECPARKSSPSDKAGRASVAKAQGATTSMTSSSTSLPYKSPPPPPPGIETSSTTSTAAPATAPSTAPATASSLDTDQVSEILNETNKVLKAISASKAAPPSQPPPSTSAPAALDPLAMIQQQINEIRGLRALVVQKDAGENMGFQSAVAMYEARLRASSVALGQGDQEALLDSGATHPLRGPSSQSEWNQARQVAVSLATGEEIMLRQNPGGTLLNGEPEGSPIIPMGQLVTLLGCSVHWTPSKLVVHHPVHGRLRVRMKGFCPVLPVSKALELISELEAARLKRFEDSIEDLRKQVSMIREQGRDGWSWQQHLRSLCEDGTRTSMAGFLHRCPTFAGVDAEALLGIPESVPCDPKDGWKLLKGAPWSRAKRKQMYQSDGWVVHLFAGDEKTSDSKTQSIMRNSFWQQALSGSEVLVEVDITATRSMDLNKQDGIFRVLAWAALSGRIKAVIGGPPRQTIPTPSQGARSQDQYHKELQLVVRMMALWYMAEEGRCKRWRQGLLQTPTVKPHVAFLLEHPEAKCREHVSLFQTSLWRMFALDALMGEVQLEINGKPTVLGGNLDLWHLQGGDLGAVGAQRWPLELVAHLVQALRAWRGLRNREGVLASLTRRSWMDLNEEVHVAKFDVKDWKLHLQRDHLPYRRDCRVCVERSSGRPHRRVRHPAAYVLSIDTAGPFRTKGVGGYKYLMVACYRLPRLTGTKSETDSLEQEESAVELKAPEDGGDWLFEDDDDGGGVGPMVKEDEAEQLGDVRGDGDDEDGEVEELKELAEPLEYMNLYMTRPLRTRTKAEALRVIQEFYIQLRSSGFPVNRLHMDRAREFQSAALEVWAASRDVEVTRTQGDDPLQNGAAERAVGESEENLQLAEVEAYRDLVHCRLWQPPLRTRKQRVSAWSSNEPPPVHTTLGAYQRGPFVGLTKATTRHQDLAVYLNKFFKKQCGEELRYTSITVAKNLHTGVHCDRFNLRNSENTVITVGDFEGGGIWQEGVSPIHPTVEIEAPNGSILKGFVQPVQNRVVKVDPKRLHMSMPWTGGTKWTLIAHTIGSKAKLNDDEVETLQGLGFPYPECSEQAQLASAQADLVVFEYEDQCLKDLSEENLHVSDGDEEWRCRYWMRRLLDEEEQLKEVVPPDLSSDFLGVDAANENCLRYLELRENFVVHERRDVHQWMQLSRLVESEQEMHGVEMVLETLEGPLQVVYTVALEDVKQNISLWSEAIHKEAKALLDAGALVPMTAEEQRKLVSTGNLVILPAKGVFTVKPPDDAVTVDGDGNPLPRGSPVFWKRKARLVICGNFQQKQAQEDSYAGGCQIDSLRAMLVFGMLRNWCFASTDIRSAFILAPIKDEEDEDQSEVYALMPPKVFQLARVPYSLQLWRVDRALYGFRRSPRLWSRFRDRRLKAARIPYGAGFLLLCQSRADANVWAITYVLDGKEEILGYLNIYVDDVLYVGQAQVIFAVQEWLTQDWKASELSWATSESAIRFLGLEIEASEGRVKINQCGYIKELLRHHDQAEGPGHATPCPPEWLVGDRVFDQVEHTEAQLRRAQVLTGELLWLSGRSRPDLMHAVATMSCLCLRNPLLVEKIGLRVLSYLRETLNYALIYQPTAEGHVLDAYSDASFSPQGEKSFGCCLVCFQGCPITWRAGRQSLVSLSVAEAELIETINASQLLSSTAAFTAELMPSEALLRINVDNAAAVALCSEAAGTWRTRHLKVRAWHLRESVRLQQVVVRHIPGLNQLADLGTKAFCKPRLRELQDLWNLRDRDERAGGVQLAAAAAEQHTSTTTAPAIVG